MEKVKERLSCVRSKSEARVGGLCPKKQVLIRTIDTYTCTAVSSGEVAPSSFFLFMVRLSRFLSTRQPVVPMSRGGC